MKRSATVASWLATLLFALVSTSAALAGTEPAGSMAASRYGHATVALPDGRALVMGGTGAGISPAIASAEVFDPTSNSFSATAPMAEGRAFAAAALLADGRVLVAGGMVTNSSPPNNRATAEIYDPATGTWSATGSMSAGRQEALAVALPGGRVLVIAGDATAQACEIFDPATGSFTPTGGLLEPRVRFFASVLPDGRVLVAGGQAASSSTVLATAETWDPVTGTWSATAPMAAARLRATATRLPDGRVLVVGGTSASANSSAVAQSEIFDPASGTFLPAGTLSVARSGHAAALLGNGDVAVAGGTVANGTLTSSIERFVMATGTWASGGAMSIERGQPSAAALANGEVLVSGGSTYNSMGATAELIDPVCVATTNSVSPGSASFGPDGGSGSLAVTHTAGCAWRVANVPTWVTLTSPATGQGSGTVTYTVADNSTTTSGRGATLRVGDASFSVSQSGNMCASATLTPSSASFAMGGGSSSFTLSALSSCAWTVTGAPSWVTPASTSGTGSATVSYSVAANAGAARSATLNVAGRSLAISQAANGCIPAPTISPASQSFAVGGGTQAVSIVAPAGCAWTVAGKPAWVSMATSGSGNATLNVTVAANTGAERSATFTVAGNSFTVTQAANLCADATLAPASLSVGAAAGTGSLELTAAAGCGWSVSGVPSWMTLTSPASGSGSATIAFSYADNAGAARSATLSVAGRSATVGQAAGPCVGSTVSPATSATFPIAGGSGSVTVNAAAECTWSVTSLPSWVTLTSASTMTGSGTVTYTVASNTGTARSGALVAAGATHTVSQAGAVAAYCAARGGSTYEWIQQVSIAGQVRASGNNGGYADFTTSTAAITLSASNSVMVTPGFSSASYSENWRGWIDFNRDGVFSDSEIVFGLGGSAAMGTTFTLPATATPGPTRMRIVMRWGSTPAACGSFSYGEVEDYTVVIP